MNSWADRWKAAGECVGRETLAEWCLGVTIAYTTLEDWIAVKGLRREDYKGLRKTLLALADELGVALPEELGSAIDIRDRINHSASRPVTQWEAAMAVRTMEAAALATAEPTDLPELPPPHVLDQIRRELEHGRGKRLLLGARTRWQEYQLGNPKGSVVTCSVVGLGRRSATLLLAPGLIGRVDISEIAVRRINAPEEYLRIGQEVRAEVLEYVPGAWQILLSIRRASAEWINAQAEAEEARQQELAAAEAVARPPFLGHLLLVIFLPIKTPLLSRPVPASGVHGRHRGTS